MITGAQKINRLIWRTRRGARELDGLLMGYASLRADAWDEQQIASFEHLLSQPDPVLLDWFMSRTQPHEAELQLLVKDILASGPGSSAPQK